MVGASEAGAATVDPAAWYVLVNRNSGKALDVSGVSTSDGAAVQQWTRRDGPNQQWLFVDSGGGFFRLRARHSGKVLDVTGASTADGADVIQWTDHNGANQQFRLATPAATTRWPPPGSPLCDRCPAASATPASRPGGSSAPSPAGAWTCRGATTNGTQVAIWDCNGQANQQWNVGVSGTITGVQSGLCLDASSQGTANGTKIILWPATARATSNGPSGNPQSKERGWPECWF